MGITAGIRFNHDHAAFCKFKKLCTNSLCQFKHHKDDAVESVDIEVAERKSNNDIVEKEHDMTEDKFGDVHSSLFTSTPKREHKCKECDNCLDKLVERMNEGHGYDSDSSFGSWPSDRLHST